MNPTPPLSVILPVYNAGPYLRDAVQSILDQSYRDFELIIMNDGSTDDSWNTLQEFKDPRIHLFTQENQGLVATLNRGIDLSNGPFIARMDQDDRSEPDRLKKQVDFLEHHTDIGVLGTTAYIMDEQQRATGVNPSLLHDTELKLQLLYQTPFVHGSVMLRRDHLFKLTPPFYRKFAGIAEDYDFWSRIATVTKLANLPEPLFGWRNNPTGMSNSGARQQREFAKQLAENNLRSPYFTRLLLNFKPDLKKYANESITINGKSVPCKRKDNYSYLLWRLSVILWHKGFRGRAVSLVLGATTSNPKFFFRALLP